MRENTSAPTEFCLVNNERRNVVQQFAYLKAIKGTKYVICMQLLNQLVLNVDNSETCNHFN
jgi:hypothetical protein